MSHDPALQRVKAIRLPSGDQAASEAELSPCVSCTGLVPSAFMIQIW
jgi:hypothetical protein